MLLIFILLFILPSSVQSQTLPALRLLAATQGIFAGSAANYYVIFQNSNPADLKNYTTLLGQQFSIVTCENCMKWAETEPQQGVFDFSQGDQIVAWAKSHDQQIRGHNLCWGQYNPSWLENGNFNSTELKALLKQHIQSVVGHWKGQLYSWDVVNEAFNEDGSMNHNIWYPAIPDYIELAFTWAREADPNVKLFYNDWGDEGINTKSNTVFNYIKGMIAKGIPIHGIGFESHFQWNNYPSQNEVTKNMQRYGDIGIEVHITEMDVDIQGDGTNQTRLDVQAEIYGGMAAACLAVKGVCKNFEVWGFTDAHSWLEKDEADLFTVNYEPRPAFWKVASVL